MLKTWCKRNWYWLAGLFGIAALLASIDPDWFPDSVVKYGLFPLGLMSIIASIWGFAIQMARPGFGLGNGADDRADSRRL